MDWWEFEKLGWSWSVGWSQDRGYFADAWRDLPQRVFVEGRWVYREHLVEIGKTILEAEGKLQQRLRGRAGG